MRMQHKIRQTDCDLLLREIRARGHQFVLPSNLPDRWLKPIARDLLAAELEEAAEGVVEGPHLMSAMIAVSALLANRIGSHAVFDESVMHSAINRYKKAVLDELLGRQTGVFRSRATLDDFLEPIECLY